MGNASFEFSIIQKEQSEHSRSLSRTHGFSIIKTERLSRTNGLLGHIIWNPFFLFFSKFSPKKNPGNVPRVCPKHSCFFLGTYLVRSGYVLGTFTYPIFRKLHFFTIFSYFLLFFSSVPVFYFSNFWCPRLLFQGVHSRWGVGMWDMCTFTLVRL